MPLYTINPSNGDNHASVFSRPSAENQYFVRTLTKGTSIEVTHNTGIWYTAVNPNKPRRSSVESPPIMGIVHTNSDVLKLRRELSFQPDDSLFVRNGDIVNILETYPAWDYNETNYPESYLIKNGADIGWCSVGYVDVTERENGDTEPDSIYVYYNDTKLISNTDVGSSTDQNIITIDMITSNLTDVTFNDLTSSANSVTDDLSKYLDMAKKVGRAYGVPPKFNVDIDPQYTNEMTPGWGRVFAKTLLSNPSIMSLCPGKVTMFPNLIGTEKDTVLESLIDAAQGNDALYNKLLADDASLFSGQMYDFSPDTYGFAKRLNTLCRATAMLLDIGDEIMPNTATKLKDFDYAMWMDREQYNVNSTDGDTSIWRDAFSAFKTAASGAISDSNYIHFFVSNSETNVNETIQTDTGANELVSKTVGSLNSLTSTLNYFLGSGFNDTSAMDEALNALLGSSDGNLINGLQTMGNDMLKGGRMVFPDQLTDTSFAQSYSCEVTFLSPYGSPLSVFMHCIVPTMNILACSLPKQLSDNMYTFPHIVRVVQQGLLSSNLAVITNVNINRGGTDNTSFSREGLATEWTVAFDIQPLVNQLILTSTDNPLLFIKNDGLIDYLGNLCAFDLKSTNLDVKKDLFLGAIVNKFAGIPNDIGRSLGDLVTDKLSSIFQL